MCSECPGSTEEEAAASPSILVPPSSFLVGYDNKYIKSEAGLKNGQPYTDEYIASVTSKNSAVIDSLSDAEKAALADFIESAVDILDRDGWCQFQLHARSYRVKEELKNEGF